MAPGVVRTIDLPPSYEEVFPFVCNRHPWMRGYVLSLPTPYAAVTDADGNYEIPHIPAGVELKLVLWHEVPRFFGAGGNKGEAITLQPGANVRDFKVKAK